MAPPRRRCPPARAASNPAGCLACHAPRDSEWKSCPSARQSSPATFRPRLNADRAGQRLRAGMATNAHSPPDASAALFLARAQTAQLPRRRLERRRPRPVRPPWRRPGSLLSCHSTPGVLKVRNATRPITMTRSSTPPISTATVWTTTPKSCRTFSHVDTTRCGLWLAERPLVHRRIVGGKRLPSGTCYAFERPLEQGNVVGLAQHAKDPCEVHRAYERQSRHDDDRNVSRLWISV